MQDDPNYTKKNRDHCSQNYDEQYLAPVVLFVYNRPDHLKQTLSGLKKNYLSAKSDLFVFSDGPKTEADRLYVDKVRRITSEISGFKSVEIVCSESNKGLAASVISGVTYVMNKYDRVIVMEDDLECTPDFLTFMNESLNRYKTCKNVFSVSGYSYPFKSLRNYPYSAYFSYRGSSWSWATWKDRWESIDWDIKDREQFIKDKKLQCAFNRGGNDLSDMLIKQVNGTIDSWAIRFAYNAHKQNKVHLLASRAKVNNIGQDNSGTHSKKTTRYNVTLQPEEYYNFPEKLEIEKNIRQEMEHFFQKNLVQKLFIWLKKASNFSKK